MVSAAMFSGTGWQHDLVAWLFTYLVHSSVLILGVWVLTRFIPKLSLDTKETMWRVALVGGLLTSLVQAGFGLTPLPGNFDMPEAMVARADESAAPVAAPVEAEEAVIERRVVEHQSGELVVTTVRESKPTVAGATVPLKASPWPWVVLGLVFAGSVFALGRLVLAARSLRKQLEGRRDVMEDPVLESHLALCAKAELKKRPKLTASPKVRSPLALMGNEICLPERAVDSLTPEQQQGMLAHELAHLIRKDPAWRFGVAIFEALFFFQPLNHLARRKLAEVAEFQCDDWAAEHTGSGVHLAKCLAEVASWLDGGPQQSAIMTAMAAPSSPIVQRITRLLGHPKARATGHAATRVAFAVFAVGAVAWFVPGVSYAQPRAVKATNVGVDDAGGVQFVDTSDGRWDRGTLHIDHGDEKVQVHVQAPKAAPPPPPEVPAIPAPPERGGDSLRIIIQGDAWGGFPFCMGTCGGGVLFDLHIDDDGGSLGLFGDLEGLENLDDLIEAEVERGLLGAFGHHGHHRDRLERARERSLRAAERARDAAERAHEAAERARGHRYPHGHEHHAEQERPSGWFGLMSQPEERPPEREELLEL